jgi:mannose-6-phosphate isomerase
MYPLRFNPIFKSAIWGGRVLADLFAGAPAEGPIGEAWVLSDQGDDVSNVADGPLRGTTLRELMRDRRLDLLGLSLVHHDTFPLLLKFIDARDNLSVQVHPDDELAQTLAAVPRGKTEAWVVLHAEPGSRIFAGLKDGVDRAQLERAIADGTTADVLHSFEAKTGQGAFLPAGTIHALGGGITIFEVQQTSDTTYRLFDWNRVDAKTGQPRDLHIEQALTSTDFTRGPVNPVTPVEDEGVGRTHRIVDCPYFGLRHTTLTEPVTMPAESAGRIIVPLRGGGDLVHGGVRSTLRLNDPILIPPGVEIALEPNKSVSFLDIDPR